MIPQSSQWPLHRNSSLANSTHQWYGLDSEELFKQHCDNTETRNELIKHGWLDTTINYKFNTQGFRSIDFDPTISAGVAFGCSFTQGVGLHVEQAWPSIVSKSLKYPIWNLGVGGCSMDTIFRLADYWLPILKPKFVLLAATFNTRLELCDSKGMFYNYLPSDNKSLLYKEWSLNTANAEINFKKNLLAIEAICNKHNIVLINLSVEDNFPSETRARDLAHSGPKDHINFANLMLEKLKEKYDYYYRSSNC